MEIKRMTVADSKKIQDFCEFDNFWNRYIFQQDIQSPNALYYQVVEQEEIVGILGASRILDVIEIRNIAVKKNKRGQGIGTKLLQHFIQELQRDKTIARIELEVSAKNTVARKLYQKQGFQTVGTRLNYYAKGEDAILMNLEMKK